VGYDDTFNDEHGETYRQNEQWSSQLMSNSHRQRSLSLPIKPLAFAHFTMDSKAVTLVGYRGK
jgi:hypothetical protein